MMDNMADWLVQNKDKIEKGVEIMGQVSEVLASTVGQLHPVLEAVFQGMSELLNNPEGKEARYLTQQFKLVNEQLDTVSDEIDQITLELQKVAMNIMNFDYEANMLSQYDKLQEFVEADPEFKAIKREKFLSQYEMTQGDMNLEALYNAVTGDNGAKVPMMETVLSIEKRSRRAVEDFCARLKKLFVLGIISIMGYAALKNGAVGEKMVKKWQGRMEDLENRMKAAVDECTEKFPEQAKEDVEDLLQKNPAAAVDDSLTSTVKGALVKKYDWVSWSIRAFNERERFFFFNWLAGKNYQGNGGSNWFHILTKNKIVVVVSFCVNPKSINKSQIQELLEQKKLKGNMENKALAVKENFPDCLVHAVSHYKEVVETNNFHEDCYYYGKHKGAYLCIHPE